MDKLAGLKLRADKSTALLLDALEHASDTGSTNKILLEKLRAEANTAFWRYEDERTLHC